MIKGLLFIGGLGVASYGAYRYYNSQISILENSDISLQNVELINQNKTNVTFRFNLKITNNSEQKFTIKNYSIQLLFNNNFIGNVNSSDLNTVIQPNGGTTPISFDFSFNPSQIGLVDILSGLISIKLKSTLSLRGRVVVKKRFFHSK